MTPVYNISSQYDACLQFLFTVWRLSTISLHSMAPVYNLSSQYGACLQSLFTAWRLSTISLHRMAPVYNLSSQYGACLQSFEDTHLVLNNNWKITLFSFKMEPETTQWYRNTCRTTFLCFRIWPLQTCRLLVCGETFIGVMVFNATFNTISVISWRPCSLICGGNRRKRPTCRIILHRVHLAWAGFELTTSVVIDTDCIGDF